MATNGALLTVFPSAKHGEGLPTPRTKAEKGKMLVERGYAIYAEAPHYGKAGAVNNRKVLILPSESNLPGHF